MPAPVSRRTVVQTGAASLGLLSLSQPARAQAWPSSPIKIICGYPAGGLTDLFARVYGEFLAQRLGQPVVIENRAGAGGGIAARAVKSAPADGHTLMFTITSTMIQNRVLFKNLGYDADNDFVLISHHSAGHLPLVVTKAVGVNTVAELVAYARQKDVNIGTYGAGTYAHVAVAELNKRFALDMKAVHYRGEAPMWQDVAAGVLQGGVGTYSAFVSLLDTGLVKVIAVPTSKRMKKLPDVPTFLEQGVTGDAFQVQGFICMVGPKGIPQDIVERLSALMVEAGRGERVQKVLDTFGIDESALGHKDFEKIYATSKPVWIQLVKDLNLSPVE